MPELIESTSQLDAQPVTTETTNTAVQNWNPEPVKEEPKTWEQDQYEPITPDTDITNMTVDELFKRQEAENNRKKIEDEEAKLLSEIVDMPLSKEKEEAKPEASDTDQEKKKEEYNKTVLKEYESRLTQIKSNYDDKIYRAEQELKAEKKRSESKESIYEWEINKLQAELARIKSDRISTEDETVVQYNYLRSEYKKNKDDPKRSKDLSKFHIRSAAIYSWVDNEQLERAIEIIKGWDKNKRDAISWWITKSGWVSASYNNYAATPTQKKKPHQALLK